MLVAGDVTGSLVSFTHSEPPAFSLSWSVRNHDKHFLHDVTGFLISCSANRTSKATPTDPITISEPVFIAHSHSESRYDGLLYFPDTCGSGVSEAIVCSVAAFNGEGEGVRSEGVTITLPCSAG